MTLPTKRRRKGGRPRTGYLEFRNGTWWAQLTLTVDGESVRQWFNLETTSRPAARIKARRIIAADAAGAIPSKAEASEQAKRAETFCEACKRCHETRKADGVSSAKDELARLTKYALSNLGELEVTLITAGHINETLDAAKAKKLARGSVMHLKQDIANVFAMLKREGAIAANPCVDVELPKFPKSVKKVRSVLTDEELIRYINWLQPEERWQMAVRERQVMACVARLFGGLRTGDLHALRWESLDTEFAPNTQLPRFEYGWVPRKKTGTPQQLAIPPDLAECLRTWWMLTGRKTSGPVFPARRGERAGEEKMKGSHAKAFREDLKRAFGLVERRSFVVTRKNQRPLTRYRWEPVREMTAREVELFTETAYTLPVDFHSWRRAYAQALADAGVPIQTAMNLTGHSSPTTHGLYTQQRKVAFPEDAGLKLSPSFASFRVQNSGAVNENSESGWQDLNLQQPAPKARLRQP